MLSADKIYSLDDLNRLFPDAAGQIRLKMALAVDHSERVGAVEKAIDHIAQDLSRTRQHRQHGSEDLLTTDIVSMLTKMGFQASHDTDVGGHCDVVIEGRDDFLWLGEAKTHTSYDWLYKGFQQLSTRYSSGIPGQDVGGLLIYCYNQGAREMMEKWKRHLTAERSDIEVAACARNPLVFRSTHAHVVSGLPYVIRHVPVLLHFKPDDRTAPRG